MHETRVAVTNAHQQIRKQCQKDQALAHRCKTRAEQWLTDNITGDHLGRQFLHGLCLRQHIATLLS